jgi:hypothetical protein
MPRPKTARKQYRCGVCGNLVWGNDDCAVHPGQLRVEWTNDFRQAYAVQADLLRQGKEPLKLEGLAGNRFELAARYARLWEGKKAG